MGKTKERKSKGKPKAEEEAPPLTRQERFCRLVACEFNTPYEAYVKAFEWDGVPAEAMKTAESLMQIPEIQSRIEELQPFDIEPARGEDMLTLGEHLRELAQLEKIAVRMGQIGAAVTAAIHRGKASGLYVERSITAKVTLEELLAHSRRDGAIEIEQGGQRVAIVDAPPRDRSGRPLLSGPKRKEA